MPDLDFVAVDFETANGKRESACAVGVTVVRNGQVQSSDSWLVKPPPSADHFERRNTAIHGITRDQCMADGLPWPETAQRLNRLCADLPVVAHNASFDESVWRAANRASGVEAPLPRFHCTLQLSRGHLDLVDHKLPTVVRHLGLDDFQHHQAEADALAAAQVTVELARRTGASTVDELWRRAPQRSATGSSPARPASSRRIPDSVFRTHVERPTTGPSLADPAVPAPTTLVDEVVLITGDLSFGTREGIQERLRRAGAIVAQSLTKKVTCLVIGAGADVRNPPLTGATGKEKKAAERIQEGQRIAVIGEPELRELLERAETGVPVEDDVDPPAVLDDAMPVGLSRPEPTTHARETDAAPEQSSMSVSASEDPSPTETRTVETHAVPTSEAAPSALPRTNSAEPASAPYAAPPRQPWDPPLSVRPRQLWDPPLPAAAPPAKPRRRWMFHVVMWSIMLFLVVGMLFVGLFLDLAGAPESVWGPVVGISWLITPLVFVAWLIVTVTRWVRGRR
ncbi:exonuclease domain-containing protein [Kocuria sp. M4R2S49]|uniref:exonuclease domain-containing protein n=1 Tax=Kocuria rhizosphaericola TaxID=3376284 RepID=UPI003793D07D